MSQKPFRAVEPEPKRVQELRQEIQRPIFDPGPHDVFPGDDDPEARLSEADHLLMLIDAEFQSDPKSVQCFDLRVVERVHAYVVGIQRGKSR